MAQPQRGNRRREGKEEEEEEEEEEGYPPRRRPSTAAEQSWTSTNRGGPTERDGLELGRLTRWWGTRLLSLLQADVGFATSD
jgi:hypothetical protein